MSLRSKLERFHCSVIIEHRAGGHILAFFLATNKHPSLLQKSVNYGCKKFYSTGPGSKNMDRILKVSLMRRPTSKKRTVSFSRQKTRFLPDVLAGCVFMTDLEMLKSAKLKNTMVCLYACMYAYLCLDYFLYECVGGSFFLPACCLPARCLPGHLPASCLPTCQLSASMPAFL